jgi:hypothetical protein
MGFYKSMVIDIIDDYARGESESQLAEKYDLEKSEGKLSKNLNIKKIEEHFEKYEVDKALSDQHAYDAAYIDHLIGKISTGEYDPELLSDAERTSIEQRLSGV